MNYTFNFKNRLGASITPDAIYVNGVSVSLGTSYSSTIADGSTIVLKVEDSGYHTYLNSFKVFDYTITVDIIMIELECNDGVDNNCCNTSVFVMDNPCNNEKYIYKTSSSPVDIMLFRDGSLLMLGKGNVITIPDCYIVEDTTFKILAIDDGGCGCDNEPVIPCEDERTIEIPYQDCNCNVSVSYGSDYCNTESYPYINYEESKYFNKERWNIIEDVDYRFDISTCVKESMLFFNQATYAYSSQVYKPAISVVVTIKDSSLDTVATKTISLVKDFNNTQLAIFLADLFIEYTFLEKDLYTLSVNVTTNCGVKTFTKTLNVVGDITLDVSEKCNEYQLNICDSIFDVVVKDINNAILATISYNLGAITTTNTKFTLDDTLKLIVNADDAVYKLEVNDGIKIVTIYLVHFCTLKDCYINLSKQLYCSEEKNNDRFVYSLISFKMLYDLIMSYYTLSFPIHIAYTALSNSENLRYIDINKALIQAKKICVECNAGVNETGDSNNDCGCN